MTRYRYKGKFVSESRAASLSNLKGARKFITSETAYPKGKTSKLSKGYQQPIEKQVKRAIAQDSVTAQKRRDARAAQAGADAAEREVFKPTDTVPLFDFESPNFEQVYGRGPDDYDFEDFDPDDFEMTDLESDNPYEE